MHPYSPGMGCGAFHLLVHYFFRVSRPSLVSNVESNVLDITNLPCEIKRELSMVAQRAGLGGNKRQRRQYFDKLGHLP